MTRISIKTPQEIEIMREAGQKLGTVREEVLRMVVPGITTLELDSATDKLIQGVGAKAAFKMVPGYHHSTCICINEEVVHGIPGNRMIGEKDKVSLDVGLLYRGFHADTAATVMADHSNNKFLDTGRQALKKAVEQAKPGKTIMDISKAMQTVIEDAGYSPVRALTGHGIGKELHEEPAIPCFAIGKDAFAIKLVEGMVLAIEVMYNEGSFDVAYKNNDGWTIATVDGKISGLFEHTVAVTKDGPVVLTEVKK